MGGKTRDDRGTPRDHQHWEAVEEASELLVEERFEDALRELKKTIEADPNNPYAYQLLGTTLWELEQIEPARDAFKAAVLVAPEFLAARVGLSHALRKLGDLGEAEREARVALARFPGDGEALHALGMVQAARGDRRGAKQSLEAYLATKPELESTIEVRSVLEMLDLGDEGDPLELDDE
jgi:Flp pilus assembly protein TadD